MANEKRLIDANAFRRRIEAFVATVRYKGIDNVPTGYETSSPTEYMRGYDRGVMDTYTVAVEQPKVDAVEVVRCKDCLFKLKPKQYGDLECGILRVPMKNDDFCSYGERRNDG
jgi:hypothetical protein